MAEQTSPADALKNFIGALPDTIRPITLSRILSSLDDDWYKRNEADYLDLVMQRIDRIDSVIGIYHYAALCGVIEVSLADASGFEEKLAKDYPDDEIFNQMSLKVPLRRRHLANAASEFQKLRQGALSPEALARWPAISMGRS